MFGDLLLRMRSVSTLRRLYDSVVTKWLCYYCYPLRVFTGVPGTNVLPSSSFAKLHRVEVSGGSGVQSWRRILDEPGKTQISSSS